MTNQEAVCSAVRFSGSLLTLASLLGLVSVPASVGLVVIILGFAVEKIFDQIDEAEAEAEQAELLAEKNKEERNV